MTAATLRVDRGDAGKSVDRQGCDAAVHGHRHVHRQQPAEPDRPGDVGLGDAVGRDDPPPGLATGVAWAREITATLSGVTSHGTLTVTAATLVSIAVTPSNPSIAKGRRSSSRPRHVHRQPTQNLTSQVTWASATPSVATIGAGRACERCRGDVEITATLGGVTSPPTR